MARLTVTNKQTTGGNSLWFILSNEANDVIEAGMFEHVKNECKLSGSILNAPCDLKYSQSVFIEIDDLVYAYYKANGVGRLGAGGDCSRHNARYSADEIDALISSL